MTIEQLQEEIESEFPSDKFSSVPLTYVLHCTEEGLKEFNASMDKIAQPIPIIIEGEIVYPEKPSFTHFYIPGIGQVEVYTDYNYGHKIEKV